MDDVFDSFRLHGRFHVKVIARSEMAEPSSQEDGRALLGSTRNDDVLIAA
jgi:hypothetical protein